MFVFGCAQGPVEKSTPPPEFEDRDSNSTIPTSEPAPATVEPPVPPLEFPKKGELDNLDLLHHYSEVAEIDESDASYADKAKAWLGFARKWADEKSYAAHAQRRAMQWLKASRTAKSWDEALAKLLRQFDGGKLSAEAMQEQIDRFVLEAPPWWQQQHDIPAQLIARLDPAQDTDPVDSSVAPSPPPPPGSPPPPPSAKTASVHRDADV
ncbi:MAG: hypothetical protein KC457_24075, partial [Myxococcales bacterium]|nr:hypothetical protein [Myxococcales bacterium]